MDAATVVITHLDSPTLHSKANTAMNLGVGMCMGAASMLKKAMMKRENSKIEMKRPPKVYQATCTLKYRQYSLSILYSLYKTVSLSTLFFFFFFFFFPLTTTTFSSLGCDSSENHDKSSYTLFVSESLLSYSLSESPPSCRRTRYLNTRAPSYRRSCLRWKALRMLPG